VGLSRPHVEGPHLAPVPVRLKPCELSFSYHISSFQRISGLPPARGAFDRPVDFRVPQFESPTGSAMTAHSLVIEAVEDERSAFVWAEEGDEVLLALAAGSGFIPRLHRAVRKFEVPGTWDVPLLIG
jgi:hypothetical protein